VSKAVHWTSDVEGRPVHFAYFGRGRDPRWHAQLDTPELGEDSCYVFNGPSLGPLLRGVKDRVGQLRELAVREVMEE
jgi:hypothetical protein